MSLAVEKFALLTKKKTEDSQQVDQIRQEMFALIRDSIPVFQLFHDLKLRDTLDTLPAPSVLFSAIEKESQQYPLSVQNLTREVLVFLLSPEKRGSGIPPQRDGDPFIKSVITNAAKVAAD